MDKCCDNCKYRAREDCKMAIDCCLEIEWSCKVDYCSKWCEKEDSLCDQLTKSLGEEPTYVLETIEYFKQRIEKSLLEYEKYACPYDCVSFINKDVRRSFSWILD